MHKAEAVTVTANIFTGIVSHARPMDEHKLTKKMAVVKHSAKTCSTVLASDTGATSGRNFMVLQDQNRRAWLQS